MASVNKDKKVRSKPWRVDYRARSGRRTTERYATKREATLRAADIEAGLEQNKVDGARLTVDELLQQWLSLNGAEWEPRTRRDRARIAERFITPYIGGARLGELTRQLIREWRRDIRGVTTGFQVNRSVQTLSAALGAAVKDDVIRVNPCVGLEPLPVERERRRPATILEVEAIRAQIVDPADRAVVSLLAYAGLRPGESRSVQWRDFADGVLVAKRGERRSGRTKTGRKRDIRLPAVVVEDLEAARLAAGDRATVHRGMDGGNWRNRVWWPACRRAGVEGITPYALRHTAASLWIAEGLPVKEVADRMGHSMKMTMETYSHLFDSDQVRRGERAADAAARARAETEHPHD